MPSMRYIWSTAVAAAGQLVKLTRCVSALSPPPIAASNFPRTCAQPPFCTSKIETSRSPKTNVIILLWLEFKNTFLKLLSCKGGSPAAKRNARYNCATSAPVGNRRKEVCELVCELVCE